MPMMTEERKKKLLLTRISTGVGFSHMATNSYPAMMIRHALVAEENRSWSKVYAHGTTSRRPA